MRTRQIQSKQGLQSEYSESNSPSVKKQQVPERLSEKLLRKVHVSCKMQNCWLPAFEIPDRTGSWKHTPAQPQKHTTHTQIIQNNPPALRQSEGSVHTESKIRLSHQFLQNLTIFPKMHPAEYIALRPSSQVRNRESYTMDLYIGFPPPLEIREQRLITVIPTRTSIIP